MEAFEYSLEVCDRDWECFFAECEECNLLPPSIAKVDDSGMSDIDDTGSIFAKIVQEVDLTAGFSAADHPIDSPPDCQGSPVDHYLSKHAITGMESILSGSEEDIHLQSVNIFFERLKNTAEAERLTEPNQERTGEKREGIREGESCSDGQQASSTILAENMPNLNSLSAKGETAVAKITEPVDRNRMKTMKKDEPDSNISPEPADSNSMLKNDRSAHPETKVIITGKDCTETRVNEGTQWSQSYGSLNKVETTSHIDKAIKVEICTPLDESKQEDLLTSQLTPSKRSSTDCWSNVEVMANVKWKENMKASQSDAISTNKTASQESSPSASVRRKRRKKRQLSVEPAESVHASERQVLVKPSDSEEEQYAWRGGTGQCASEDVTFFNLKGPQNHVMSSPPAYSVTSNLPVRMSANEIKVNDLSHCNPPWESQYQYSSESIVRQARYKATCSAENGRTNDRPVTPLSSITDRVNGKSDLTTETANCQRSNKMIRSIICCENEQLYTAEDKSLNPSILARAESNDPTVEVSQNDTPSAAKSVLAEEAGNPGKHHHTLRQRESEPQQQLEISCHDTDQYKSTLENTHFPLSAVCTSSSDAHNTKPNQFNARACPLLELSSQVECDKSALDTTNLLPDKCCPSKICSSLDTNIPGQQTERPVVLHTLPKLDVLSEKNTTADKAELPASQIMAFNSVNLFHSGEFNLIGKSQRETKLSISEDSLMSPSDITPVSSCFTLDTESIMSLSNENITDMSESSCISVSQNDSRFPGDKTSQEEEEQEEGDGTKSQSLSNYATDSKCDLVLEIEDAVTACKAEGKPEKDSKHSVFVMSSFWSEMEKLTINDILDLRMISKAAPHTLPPLQDREPTDVFAPTDSVLYAQLDESEPEQTNDDTVSAPNSVESSLGSSGGVMWKSDSVPVSLSADVYADNLMLTSVNDSSQLAGPGRSQMCFKKICKNVSVQNLRALESVSYTRKGQTLQTFDEGELEKAEYFTDGHVSTKDEEGNCLASSATDSYSISLTGIFQYLFGRKQSHPKQSATDNTTGYTDGSSVPENYDHFFSEFDTESFFYPLITSEEDQARDELVPVFAYTRSANRNLQFPEAYDYFFASSSSDDSSVESDEEDYCGPVRVVNRFTRTSSTSKFSTDIYDSFFSDSDLRQNFFWKNTFSFRNISFTRSTVNQQTISNPFDPVRPSGRSFQRRDHPLNALGNQDVMFSDPLLNSLEDRFSRQQPFRYEDLETTLPNPSKSISHA